MYEAPPIIHHEIVGSLVAAARRRPTPAALASVQAALRGRPTPAALAAHDPLDADLVRHRPRPRLSLAGPAQPPPAATAVPLNLDPPRWLDPARPDPHDQGQPDPSLDWLFQPHPRRVSRRQE